MPSLVEAAVSQIVHEKILQESKPVVKQSWWVLYARDAYTTGLWMELALRRCPDVQVLGIGIGNEVPTEETVMIPALLREHPAPDVMLVMDGFRPMTIHGLDLLKGPKLYYALDTHLNPHRNPQEWNQYDAVFTPHQETITRWGGRGVWLPHAAEPMIHRPLKNHPVVYDVAFVGGTDLAEAHARRRTLLKSLAAKYKVWVGRAYGVFLSIVYAKSKLVFNCSVGGEVNQRIFEGAACRRAVVTDGLEEGRGLGNLFTDQEITTYTDETLLSIVETLLADEPARTRLAEAGYQRVLKDHTYDRRIQEVLQWLSRPRP